MKLAFFNDSDLEKLLAGQSIANHYPWNSKNDAVVEQFYRNVCQQVQAATDTSSVLEFDDYGSGYASYIDAWFYRNQPQFRLTSVGHEHHYTGLIILFSRLAPYFVFMQGERSWSENQGSSSYLPEMDMLDDLYADPVCELAKTVQPLLEGLGLKRLLRAELSGILDKKWQVPTILNSGDFTEYDALFYWED